MRQGCRVTVSWQSQDVPGPSWARALSGRARAAGEEGPGGEAVAACASASSSAAAGRGRTITSRPPGLQPALGLGNLARPRRSHPPSARQRAAGPAARRKPTAAGVPPEPAARPACGRPGQRGAVCGRLARRRSRTKNHPLPGGLGLGDAARELSF